MLALPVCGNETPPRETWERPREERRRCQSGENCAGGLPTQLCSRATQTTSGWWALRRSIWEFPRDLSPSPQQRGAFKNGSSRSSQKNHSPWAAATTPTSTSLLRAGDNEVASPHTGRSGKVCGGGQRAAGSCYQDK